MFIEKFQNYDKWNMSGNILKWKVNTVIGNLSTLNNK